MFDLFFSGKYEMKKIDTINNIDYYQIDGPNYKYTAYLKTGLNVVLVSGNDTETMAHVFKTMQI